MRYLYGRRILDSKMKMPLNCSLICLLLAVPMHGEQVRLDGVAAYVNDAVITVSEVLGAMESQKKQMENRFSGAELDSQLGKVYHEALNALVERRLILKSYETQKLKIPDALVDRRINELINERFDNDRSALLAELAGDRMTFEDWRTKVREQMVIGAMRHEFVEKYLNISPAAARKFYDTNPDRFRTAGKIHLLMIIIEKGASSESANVKRAVVDDAMKRLRAGEDFAAVAKAVSEDSKAATGGDWGWVDLRLLQAKIAEPAQRLQPRQFCGPVETDTSFYILQCAGRQDPAVTPFEEVRAVIEKEIESAEGERLYRAWMDRLRAGVYINLKNEIPF